MESDPSPSHRAILIGIDDYTRKPLDGCVNDIDQIERLLLDGLRVPAERITRLAAPRAGAATSTRLPSLPPTRDGIWNALNRLAEEVGPEDLVFLYYSGHGSQGRIQVNGQVAAREALVPVDCANEGGPPRLLYDFELNGLLTRIANRAGDLTVVLDCCHSASVTREEITPGGKSRYLPMPGVRDFGTTPPPGLTRDSGRLLPGGSVPMLVAACRASELSYETVPEESPRPHGAFTHALVQILDAADRPLSELRWSDLWTVLVDRMARRNSFQHPQMVGRWERRLFGGPWTPRDPGYPVRREGSRFRLGAGTLTGLSDGAEVAVYGPQPDRFPPLGSAEERAARIGLLRVTSAELSAATAVSAHANLQLPEGARGRLVKPGDPDRLTLALDPYDPVLIRRLKARGVVAVPAGEPGAEAFLRRDEKGWLHLGDALHGDGRDPGRPPLASFPETARLTLERVVHHYSLYVRTLRLPARCRDLDGMLEVELIDGRQAYALKGEELLAPDLPLLALDDPYAYKVREGDGFAIRIANRAGTPLYATVLNCTASGRVEPLGHVDVPAGARQVVWREGILGSAFYPAVGVDRPECVDRMVVVGTTLPDRDLSYLGVPRSFAEIVRGDREAGGGSAANFPAERWTAVMTTLRIYRSVSPTPGDRNRTAAG